MKIFIYGGCVSRDIFNFDNSKEHVIDKYFARSVISSAFESVEVEDHWSEKIVSNFQKRIVSSDLKKTLSKEIENSHFDIFLIDFMSERHPLFIFKNGARCTLSTEIMSAGFPHNDTTIGRKVLPFSDEMFLLWESGWQKFINLMAALDKKHLILVNEIYWCNKVDDNSSFNDKFSEEFILEANSYLSRIYNRVLEDIPKVQFLSIDEKYSIAASNHRWGKSPFHFIDAYYKIKLDKISSYSTAKNKCFTNADKIISISDIYEQDTPLSEQGVYKISFNKNMFLDVYSSGLSTEKQILVCFNGAVSNRIEKKPPFFSGKNIQKEFNLPIISISDPTLSLDNSLPLAWYAGNHIDQELPIKISELLDALANKNDAELILFGGSGGGFATLIQAGLIQAKFKCLVWNPQTDISKYSKRFVLKYISSAFPDYYLNNSDILNSNISQDDLKKALDECISFPSALNINRKNNQGTIYLQNHDDWHRYSHAKPFLESLGFTDFDNSAELILENTGVIYTYYGSGHIAPGRSDISYMLNLLIEHSDFKSIYNNAKKYCLEQFPDELIDTQEKIDFNTSQFDINIERKNDEFSITIESEHRSVDYSFYILRNGIRESIIPYSKNNNIKIKPLSEGYEIICFVRATNGDRKSKRVHLWSA
ncbi:DUF6270 domain-containing protein [Aeromonas hydrophila]